MTDEELNEIERIDRARTRGIWDRRESAATVGPLSDEQLASLGSNLTRADFDFVTMASYAVPALVAEVRRLRDERDDAVRMRSQACAAVVLAQEWIAERDAKIDSARAEVERLTKERDFQLACALHQQVEVERLNAALGQQPAKCNGRPTCQNTAAPLHGCPYKEDVNNNYTDQCDCCAECQHECAMDI